MAIQISSGTFCYFSCRGYIIDTKDHFSSGEQNKNIFKPELQNSQNAVFETHEEKKKPLPEQ